MLRTETDDKDRRGMSEHNSTSTDCEGITSHRHAPGCRADIKTPLITHKINLETAASIEGHIN